MQRIAVLLTCHNRCAKTLACLDALYSCKLPTGYLLDVFLVDDGSTDGTEQAVRECYPQVNIIRGDGNLYWNGGMRVAFAAAMEKGFDYYLWLNDDTLLYPTSIETLVNTAQGLRAKQGKSVIVAGSTQDPQTGQLTYGGVVRQSRLKPFRFVLVKPRDSPLECHAMNGNCVLIPHDVARRLGNLDPCFAHAMGDTDYGLRAEKAGVKLWVAPGFVGVCSRNEIVGTYNDLTLPLLTRWKKMMQPKGLPLSSWRVFTQRHAGVLWPIYWLWPYVKLVASAASDRLINSKR